tara:strand:- start:3074 stop:4057 length:984 start_codon:yes stop_codon:yes gene_type:complete
MKICFIDKTEFAYSFKDINTSKLRGAESILINLSNELSKLGHEVCVFNNCEIETNNNNYSWQNINKLEKNTDYFDVVISNGDCNHFKLASSRNNILISHSNQPIEQFIRKNQFFSYIKYKPKIWCTSKFQVKNRSFLMKMFGHILLPWSVDNIFIKYNIENNINNNQAIFTSRPDRNQELLTKIWINSIHPNLPEKKLLIFGSKKKYEKGNIVNKNFTSQKDLLKDICTSRIFLVPGHKAETFCLAAAEARELCVPIVTMGLGCLSERVEHGITGFIAKNTNEFKNFAIELFKDENLWISLRNNLISKRGHYNWTKVAKQLTNQINV